MKNKANEIKALLQLLDDPSDEVFMHVAQNILKQGEEIIPELEKAWEKSLNAILQERIENLIQEIQFTSTLNQLKEWKDSGALNLLKDQGLNYYFFDKMLHLRQLLHLLYGKIHIFL